MEITEEFILNYLEETLQNTKDELLRDPKNTRLLSNMNIEEMVIQFQKEKLITN